MGFFCALILTLSRLVKTLRLCEQCYFVRKKWIKRLTIFDFKCYKTDDCIIKKHQIKKQQSLLCIQKFISLMIAHCQIVFHVALF